MCGIAGWIDNNSDLSTRKYIVEEMMSRLASRGPDAGGIWVSPKALVGHRRLIVVDPSGGGQPMIRSKGNLDFVLTYNGELYNTEELRKELRERGHRFEGTSDTEVLLLSYIEWGPDCLDRLNGIFAFGVWDDKNKSLFLARDRFGVKPLFYALQGSSLVFASELKALLAHPLVKPDVGAEGLAEVFALGPARTPGHGVYKGVSELCPAHCMLFDSNGPKLRCYWSLKSLPHNDSLDVTINKVRELTIDSILRQLVADVSVCTFLSGGLDSSAITAIAAKNFSETGRGQLHTYSIDYAGNDKHFKSSNFQPDSDAPWVKRMSDEYGTIHHNFTVDTFELAEALEDAALARDLPGMADIDSSLLLLCREIKKEHIVSLSGECADEVFGGYPWFHREDLMNCGTFPWAKSMDERTRVLSQELIEMIKPGEYMQKRYYETLDEVPRLPGEDIIEARRREIFYLNIYWFMANLLDRKDRMSMASGLEVRVPYCDHRLVQYVWNIPWNMKMINGREKGILRNALERLLPNDILWRKKSPYPKTHNPLYESLVKNRLLEILNDSSSPLLPLVNRKVLLSMAEGQSHYGKPWFGQLMAEPQLYAYLIQADVWLREYKVRIV